MFETGSVLAGGPAEEAHMSNGKADGVKDGIPDVHAKVTAWVERELMPAINKQVSCSNVRHVRPCTGMQV